VRSTNNLLPWRIYFVLGKKGSLQLGSRGQRRLGDAICGKLNLRGEGGPEKVGGGRLGVDAGGKGPVPSNREKPLSRSRKVSTWGSKLPKKIVEKKK